jgi:hypothetical protein
MVLLLLEEDQGLLVLAVLELGLTDAPPDLKCKRVRCYITMKTDGKTDGNGNLKKYWD